VPEPVVAAAPVVAGWLLQLTELSDQDPASRSALIVRPEAAEAACSRSVADSTTQPCGFVGIEKRTTARRLLLGPFDMTLSVESVPLFEDALPWSIQLSAFAVNVTVEPQSTGASIVQV
jgi:hypothetical protein